MAIRIIYGPGGSGKSRFQIELIVKQLRDTNRNIVTNLSVNLGRLNEYIQETYPRESVDVVGRVRILTVEETKEFWKVRGPLRWTGNEYDLEPDNGVNGVCYVIDEAGAAGFDAQGWAESDGKSSRGVRAKWYLDQQRKFGDDVFASTNGRAPSGIAKAFRDKAHGFIRLKNNRLAVFGPFRGRDNFKWEEFTREPHAASDDAAIASGTFKLDEKGLASCYRTEEGVGVIGKGADKGARAKGIPILWIFPIVFLVGGFVAVIPYALGKATQKVLTGSGSQVQQKIENAKGVVGPGVLRPGAEVEPQPTRPPPPPGAPVPALAPKPYVTGLARAGGRVRVTLSDRRVLSESDGVARVLGAGVLLSTGELLPFARMVPGVPPFIPSKNGLAPRSVEPEAKTRP